MAGCTPGRQAAGAVGAEVLAAAPLRRYAAERRGIATCPSATAGPRPSGGVGGTRRGGASALHAHLAWYLVGGDDPVGRWVEGQLGLDTTAYVVDPGTWPMTPGLVAALDCGTNSTRILIVDGDGAVVEREMRITRLGEAVDATHKLSADAVARTVAVLRDYRRLMDAAGVVRARLVATSAARDAVNADEFFAAAEEATGVKPELLSGGEEGQLSFTGATASLPAAGPGGEPILVVDIGGGSTELVVGVRADEGRWR